MKRQVKIPKEHAHPEELMIQLLSSRRWDHQVIRFKASSNRSNVQNDCHPLKSKAIRVHFGDETTEGI